MKKTKTSFLLLLLTLSLTQANAQVKVEADVAKTAGEKILLEANKKNKEAADPVKAEFDSGALEKKFAKDPEFSSDSANQKEVDKTLAANDKKFDSKTESHINELYKCQKLSTTDLIKKCRDQQIKIKSK